VEQVGRQVKKLIGIVRAYPGELVEQKVGVIVSRHLEAGHKRRTVTVTVNQVRTKLRRVIRENPLRNLQRPEIVGISERQQFAGIIEGSAMIVRRSMLVKIPVGIAVGSIANLLGPAIGIQIGEERRQVDFPGADAFVSSKNIVVTAGDSAGRIHEVGSRRGGNTTMRLVMNRV